MMKGKHLRDDGKPVRILWFGDLVAPSGFGRIGTEICRRLRQRGYELQAAALNYSGWPHDLPFHVWPLAGQDAWGTLVNISTGFQPDLLISCQDFPYHQTIWQACRLDFSKLKWIWITPIDGTPVHPDWAKLTDWADGAMVISRFGVEALRQAGRRVALCHPGVDTGEFYPTEPAERAELRKKAGWAAEDYVVGVMCMNQGRKAIAPMIEAFGEFGRDKPEAKLLLDMDKVSPAGWDIPNLLKQLGWSEAEQGRVKYREDLFKADMEAFAPLRNRYGTLDLHMVISHREGFGLPLLESMACRVPTMALDWCSGTEICGEGRGYLVRRLDYMEHGSWGGARDAFPDMGDFVAQLNRAHAKREEAAAIAAAGLEWAVRQSWDVATDQVEAVVQAALKRDRKVKPSHEPVSDPNPAPGLSDTAGPGGGSGVPAQPVVGGDPGVQPVGAADPAAEEPGEDGGAGGAGAAAGNIGAG